MVAIRLKTDPAKKHLIYRGAIVGGAALLAYWQGSTLIGWNMSRNQPIQAVAFAPGNAVLLGRAAIAQATTTPSPAERVRISASSRRALNRDLTNVNAVVAEATLTTDEASAAAMMGYSDRLSRRDLVTRLWFIEHAVQRGDVIGALKHFDIALRTSNEAADMLFPILGKAIEDDTIMPALARVLAKQPAWAGQFLYVTATNGLSVRNLARLVQMLPVVPPYQDQDLRTVVLAALVTGNAFADARRFDGATGSGWQVNDPQFAKTTFRAPVSWEFSDDADIGSEPVDGGLRAFAVADRGGIVVSQVLAMPLGRYRLTSSRSNGGTLTIGAPEWAVTCAGANGPTVGTLRLANQGPNTQTFSVPADCPAQWLRLRLTATSNVQDHVIRSVAIHPAP